MDVPTPRSRQDLHAQLDDLLDSVEEADGQLDPSQLFWFALNVAYGRGVDEHYHRVGIEEVEWLRSSAAESEREYQHRCERVYTLNILARLLKDINCLPHDHEELRGGASGGILPTNFALSPLLLDCVSALASAGQTNAEGGAISANSPFMFQIETKGNWALRPHARAAVVKAIYYQADYQKITITESRASLEPELGEKTFWRWVAEAGGAEGPLVAEAKQAARDGAVGADWMHAFDTREFQNLYAIARGKDPRALET
jgi:hypothetical protein